MNDDEGRLQERHPAPLLFVAPQQVTAPESAAPPPERGRDEDRRRSGSSEEANETATASRRRTRRRRSSGSTTEQEQEPAERSESAEAEAGDDSDSSKGRRGRRGRRGRGRGKGAGESDAEPESAETDSPSEAELDEGVTRRRRRRRKRAGTAGADDNSAPDAGEVVVKVRRSRGNTEDDVQGLTGSTRLEAKRQRRREGRSQRRTRPQVLSESEFLARRESVERRMVVRGGGNRIQLAVLEDDMLVEHFVSRAGSQSMVGNVYLGKVQNILPSMEAAFVDIGRGRNAVLYAGEVNWDRTGLSGRTRTIEQAMNPGDAVLVQVTKDPVGHKGARLTSHIALSGRHLVYVPHGNASGISRKLPDSERRRLRGILKRLVPEGAGVIVRTAAEGADEGDLERDISRLREEWDRIEAKSAKGNAPTLLHAEPDLLLRVVRDVFNEDFSELVVDTEDTHRQIHEYLESVSPDLVRRLKRHAGVEDVFAAQRVDEQLLKALDRKVYLPSGGSLVIDRTEAMTVVDVNTGKFTGSGGNLEETVTRNNLEAAEEIVRQLRLRDVGGIVVIDFIDMVLESNRDLVLRRLTECLGRDRTKHQVTEITSLGLVQMTRKRVGQGLLEAFSEPCEHCKGRGLTVNTELVEHGSKPEKNKSGGKRKSKAKGASEAAKSAAASTRKIAEAGTAEANGSDEAAA